MAPVAQLPRRPVRAPDPRGSGLQQPSSTSNASTPSVTHQIPNRLSEKSQNVLSRTANPATPVPHNTKQSGLATPVPHNTKQSGLATPVPHNTKQSGLATLRDLALSLGDSSLPSSLPGQQRPPVRVDGFGSQSQSSSSRAGTSSSPSGASSGPSHDKVLRHTKTGRVTKQRKGTAGYPAVQAVINTLKTDTAVVSAKAISGMQEEKGKMETIRKERTPLLAELAKLTSPSETSKGRERRKFIEARIEVLDESYERAKSLYELHSKTLAKMRSEAKHEQLSSHSPPSKATIDSLSLIHI